MKLKDLTKAELEAMSYDDIALMVLSESNRQMKINELFKEVCNHLELSEDELMNKIETNINSEDIMYTMMNIKEEGYSLYVNSDNKLVVSYYEVNDENSVRNELVL